MPRTDEEIIAALNEAANQDAADNASLDPVTIEPAAEQEVVEPPTADTDVEVENFTDFDISALPDELAQAAEVIKRRMQADYTRKTTSLAERQKQLEQHFGDLETAKEAITFYEQFHTNPQYAYATVNRAIPALANIGYADSLRQLLGVPDTGRVIDTSGDLDFNEDEFDDPTNRKISELESKLQNFERAQVMQAQREAQNNAQLALLGEWQRQENIILAENPKYTDEDLDEIYKLAPAFGNNLLNAQRYVQERETQQLTKFLAKKKANETPNPGTAFPSVNSAGTQSATPEVPTYEAGRERAMARIRALGL